MTLKESFVEDWTTFINLDEFAELIDYNGAKIPAVVTQTSAESKSSYTVKKQIAPARHLNLRGEFLVVYLKTADLEKLPRRGDFVNVNGTRYKVNEALELHGICRISCSTDLDKGAIPRPAFGG